MAGGRGLSKKLQKDLLPRGWASADMISSPPSPMASDGGARASGLCPVPSPKTQTLILPRDLDLLLLSDSGGTGKSPPQLLWLVSVSFKGP